MTRRKEHRSARQDPRTLQACAAVQRALSAALASNFDDPLLLSLYVEQVLPAPSLAHLLVVVAASDPDAELDSARVLAALDRARGSLRAEVATELNHKRTPELSFTVDTSQRDGDDYGDGSDGENRGGDDHDEFVDPDEHAGAEQVTVRSEANAPYDALLGSPPTSPLNGPESRSNTGLTDASATSKLHDHPWHAATHHKPARQQRPRNQKRALRRAAKQARRNSSTPCIDAPEEHLFEVTETGGAAPIKRWTRGVPVETEALHQLANIAKLPIIAGWVAAMPDVHVGIGATVGSVIPTVSAVIPAAVGVDIGCGMSAVRTTLRACDLPDSLRGLRSAIERAVPHGVGGHGSHAAGGWGDPPSSVATAWSKLSDEFTQLAKRHAVAKGVRPVHQLGTLGGGNHFIELCLDELDRVWLMLHSGSRGVGNRIGTHFIELAKRDMEAQLGNLPDKNLAYFEEGNPHFAEYMNAVGWAQRFAKANREVMVSHVLAALRASSELPDFTTDEAVVDCHHNYVAQERHGGRDVLVTRKGAVRAGLGELGIIPGSMGARSFIVRGKGNPESLCSCSHGAGRRMSRGEARRRYSVADHARMTDGVECRKDAHVVDEIPAAYKDIAQVMAAQADLVSIEHTLKQVLCVKG